MYDDERAYRDDGAIYNILIYYDVHGAHPVFGKNEFMLCVRVHLVYLKVIFVVVNSR